MLRSIYILFIILFFFSCSARQKEIFYSSYVPKSQKDHSVSLPKFIKVVSQQNAQGIIDGFNIEIQKEIKLDNIKGLNLIFRNSTIYANNRFSGGFLKFSNSSDINIIDLKIEQQRMKLQIYEESEYPQIFNAGLIFFRTKNISVTKSQFLNLYTRGIQITESFGNIDISSNLFTSNLQDQKFLMEHLVFGSCPNAVIVVDKNKFINEKYTNPDFGICAISGYGLGKNGGSVTVSDNLINYAGRNNAGHHRLYAIDFYDDADDIKITANKLDNIMWGAIRFNGTSENAEISYNKIEVKNPDDTATITSSTTESIKFFKNIHVNNNTITSLVPLNSAILFQNQFEKIKLYNICVQNNILNNNYYNIYFTGFFENVTVKKNEISGKNSVFGIYFLLNPNKYEKSLIKLVSNKIESTNTGISLNTKDNGSAEYKFSIIDNILTNNLNKGGFGLLLNIGLKGSAEITANTISNFGNAFYMREKEYRLNSNKFLNNTSDLLKD